MASPVIVAGAGITGLTVAYELQKRGVEAVVLEASDRAGGLIRTDRVDGFTIEAGPDSLLAAKPAAIELCQELGLSDRLQQTRPPGGAYVLRGTRLYRLPSPSVLGLPLSLRALFTYDLLPLAARARLALEPFVPRPAAAGADDDESVASFFRRRFGPATIDLIAQPLLGGIHAGDIEQLSMRSLFPRLLDLEARHGSVLHGGKYENAKARRAGRGAGGRPTSPFVSLRGGMQTIVDALTARLRGALRLGTRVTGLERTAAGWDVSAVSDRGPERLAARAVVLAVPAHAAARILDPLDRPAADICREVPYVSTASVALAWPRAAVAHPLEGTGFVVARRTSDVRITACTWVSEKWEERAPAGAALMRAFVGGQHDPGIVDLSDDEIVGIARRDLGRVLGIREAPALARVWRWRDAGAQHVVGERSRVAALEARLAAVGDLHVAGSGFRSVGIPDCIVDARAVAARL